MQRRGSEENRGGDMLVGAQELAYGTVRIGRRVERARGGAGPSPPMG
jgi:hypothetical protein